MLANCGDEVDRHCAHGTSAFLQHQRIPQHIFLWHRVATHTACELGLAARVEDQHVSRLVPPGRAEPCTAANCSGVNRPEFLVGGVPGGLLAASVWVVVMRLSLFRHAEHIGTDHGFRLVGTEQSWSVCTHLFPASYSKHRYAKPFVILVCSR